MSEAKEGDTVRIHYTGRLDDGTVFDSSREREPLEFTIGEGKVIPGFEKAVEGMAEGESKTASIPPQEAYGPRNEEMVLSVPRDRLPDELDPEVGQRLQMQTEDGRVFEVTVADFEEESVTLDANHPLAGEDLTFELEVVRID